jgi:malate dehydrogenase
MLDGEYGQKDVALGVPVKLGQNGVEEIIELKLNDDEMALMQTSSDHVKAVMKVLDDLKLF